MDQGVVKKTETRRAEVSQIITRCGCGHPEWHNGSPQCKCGASDGLTWHAGVGPEHVCPQPKRIDNLGVVDRYDSSLWGKIAWQLLHRWRAYIRIKVANARIGRWS